MLPSREEIERAAYDRWEQRGRAHGTDHEDWIASELDLTFAGNYDTIAEYATATGARVILGDPKRPCCRFCEQSAPRTTFTAVRPVAPEYVGNTSLFTAELCDECAEQFADSIDAEFRTFWDGLLRPAPEVIGQPTTIPMGAYKALARIALSIMPARELGTFTDTLEWVGNPDHDFDSTLFRHAGCLAYALNRPLDASWISLARRRYEDALFPYMLVFLGSGPVVLQGLLPLAAQDDDLDGATVRMPRRSFSTGYGSELVVSPCRSIPLQSADRPRQQRRRMLT